MTEGPVARILIIDDTIAQVNELCETLRDCGYEAVGFTTSPSALAALRGGSYDLLLVHVKMSDMGGPTLVRESLAADPHVVCVALADQSAIDPAVDAMKAGAIDYIVKPFTRRAIMPVVSRALVVGRLRVENTELVRRVAERTAELETARKELEALHYSVSHDLRAPLRAVHAFSHILQEQFESQIPAEARRLLRLVTTSAARMEHMIQGLLRLSRLARQPLVKQPTDVSTLVREVVDELRRDQVDSRTEVEIGELPDATADPALVKHVFANLLSNAFKFSRLKDTPLVDVGCRQKPGERVYFVRDNGAGFDMRYADKLFGVFQRFHRDDEFEGTGVGLAIAQRIVQRHGGRMWAEAAVDKGATFNFTLGA